MAIYDFLNAEKGELDSATDLNTLSAPTIPQGSKWFSLVATRMFFLLLLLADILWGCYAALLSILSFCGLLLTGFKAQGFKVVHRNALISLRRSMVCGVSLFVALFSPSFGIMVACTYFSCTTNRESKRLYRPLCKRRSKSFFRRKRIDLLKIVIGKSWSFFLEKIQEGTCRLCNGVNQLLLTYMFHKISHIDMNGSIG